MSGDAGTRVRGEERTRALWQWAIPLLGALVILLYFPVLQGLIKQWWNEPDFSHGFIVPVFAGYVVWLTRKRWQAIPPQPDDKGVFVIVVALCMLLAGSVAAVLFVSRLSMVVLLLGIVLYLAGREMVSALAFPLGYLLLMIPPPEIIYNQITFPMQLWASKVAFVFLQWVHVPVLLEGNILLLPNYSLEVAEACSGIRSLLSLIALAVAYGYIAEKRGWLRVVLVVMTVPVAILSNSLRVFGTGLATYWVGPEWANGFLHEMSGFVVFFVAAGFIVVVHWIITMLLRQRNAK
jgi:exosortase